jgi:hypothetical protein
MQDYEAPIQPTILRSQCESVLQVYRAHNGDLVLTERGNAAPHVRQISLTRDELALLRFYLDDTYGPNLDKGFCDHKEDTSDGVSG